MGCLTVWHFPAKAFNAEAAELAEKTALVNSASLRLGVEELLEAALLLLEPDRFHLHRRV